MKTTIRVFLLALLLAGSVTAQVQRQIKELPEATTMASAKRSTAGS